MTTLRAAAVAAVVAAAATVAAAHECIHDAIQRTLTTTASHAERHAQTTTTQVYRDLHDAAGRRLQGTTYSPIRVKFDTAMLEAGADPLACQFAGQVIPLTLAATSADTFTCTAGDVLTDDKRNFIRTQLVPAVNDLLQSTLSVVPVVGPLVLNNPMPDSHCAGVGYYYRLVCCASAWPAAYRSPGAADADFVVVLTARPTAGATLAWAVECMADQIARPVAAQANLSPRQVSTAAATLYYQYQVLLHELLHTLGFNAAKMAYFRQPGTTLPAAGDTTVLDYEPGLGKFVTRVVTPKVVAAAKAHYNCLDWPGAGMELEDGGGGGTVGSHWERRVALYELMNGYAEATAGMYLSALTLAYFDDSGWYSVNYGRADKLMWGNGEGCAFVTSTCAAWGARYLCTTPAAAGCTADLRAVGTCNFSPEVNPTQAWYRYFAGGGGGTEEASDYCPYYMSVAGRDCSAAGAVAYFVYGEAPGAGARCFAGTYQRASSTLPEAVHGGCLATACDAVTNAITVTLSGSPPTVVRCPRAGGRVYLAAVAGSSYKGYLDCPRADVLCTGDACSMNDCGRHGTCNPTDGTCACFAGYYGADAYTCDRLHCPTAAAGVECSAHGACNYRTGVCEDGTGLPGCDAGWKGAACDVQGCPLSASPACATPGVPCECGGRGTCAAGACTCHAGFVGTGCQYTDCPVAGGARCSGAGSGVCDGATGLCTCADGVDAGGGAHYTAGAACQVAHNGSRPLAPLAFMYERDGNNVTHYPVNATLAAKEYAFFTFPVPSTQYALQLLVAADAAAAARGVTPRVTAAYAGDPRPDASAAAFYASATGVAGQQLLEFAPGERSRFTRTGDMVVAVAADAAANYTLRLTRDGCSTLQCLYGRCVDSACLCDAGWTGPTCRVPDCPGTPDCGARGTCVADHCIDAAGSPIRFCHPACECSSFFSGPACSAVVVDAATTAPSLRFAAMLLPLAGGMATAQTGAATLLVNTSDATGVITASADAVLDLGAFHTVAVVDPHDFAAHLTGPLGIYLALSFDASPSADGMLLGAENTPPDVAAMAHTPMDFDVQAWRRHRTSQVVVHRLANNDASTVYLARVFNGRYGGERLQYHLHMEVTAGVCAPALAACHGHGVCDLATYTCACDAGYVGVACEDVVTPLAAPAAVAVGPLPPATWAYYALPLAGSDVQLRVTLRAEAGQPVLAAAFDTTLPPRSVAALTSEAALVDAAGNGAVLAALATAATPGAVPAALPPQTLLLRRQRADVVLLVGVLSAPRARAPLRATLTVEAYNVSATAACAATDAACMAAACHHHGTYVADAVGCRCELGWNEASDCASPRVASLASLLTAAQDVQSLCSMCTAAPHLNATGDITVYAVPQALQKSTAVRLAVAAQAGGSGVPAVFVAPVLPRSLVDFLAIASSSATNATLLLPPSYTGRHFAAVMAQAPGTFAVTASRALVTATVAPPPSTWAQLRRWLLSTTAGYVVLGTGAALLVLVALGCVIQCCTHRSLEQKLDAMLTAGNDLRAMHHRDAALAHALAVHGTDSLAGKPALARLAQTLHVPVDAPLSAATDGTPAPPAVRPHAVPASLRSASRAAVTATSATSAPVVVQSAPAASAPVATQRAPTPATPGHAVGFVTPVTPAYAVGTYAPGAPVTYAPGAPVTYAPGAPHPYATGAPMAYGRAPYAIGAPYPYAGAAVVTPFSLPRYDFHSAAGAAGGAPLVPTPPAYRVPVVGAASAPPTADAFLGSNPMYATSPMRAQPASPPRPPAATPTYFAAAPAVPSAPALAPTPPPASRLLSRRTLTPATSSSDRIATL